MELVAGGSLQQRQLMFAHVTLPTPDPRTDAPEVPAALVEVLQRATAKDPAARYTDAEAMSAALEAVLSGGRSPNWRGRRGPPG
jgi:serine/threonine-protein kinase